MTKCFGCGCDLDVLSKDPIRGNDQMPYCTSECYNKYADTPVTVDETKCCGGGCKSEPPSAEDCANMYKKPASPAPDTAIQLPLADDAAKMINTTACDDQDMVQCAVCSKVFDCAQNQEYQKLLSSNTASPLCSYQCAVTWGGGAFKWPDGASVKEPVAEVVKPLVHAERAKHEYIDLGLMKATKLGKVTKAPLSSNIERWTDRARKAMLLANQEAVNLNHEYIGTEHILLGILKEGSGVAVKVLNDLNVDMSKLCMAIRDVVQPGPEAVTRGKLPQTPWAKQVVALANSFSAEMEHTHVGTEHMLLGLLKIDAGVAWKVLKDAKVTVEAVKELLPKQWGKSATGLEAYIHHSKRLPGNCACSFECEGKRETFTFQTNAEMVEFVEKRETLLQQTVASLNSKRDEFTKLWILLHQIDACWDMSRNGSFDDMKKFEEFLKDRMAAAKEARS